MVRYVYASSGVPEQVQHLFTGQPKRHEDGSEWEELLHRKLAAYWYQAFLLNIGWKSRK